MCSCARRGSPVTPGDPAVVPPATVVVEVTDTLNAPFTTGIQRVVREVVAGLQGPAGAGFEVVPVIDPLRGTGFRRLTADEQERLATHPTGGRAGRRADGFGVLSPLVRRIGDLPLTVRVRTALARRRPRPVAALVPELAFSPPPGSVFVDLEGSWYNPTPRAELLPALVAAGVHRVVFVHDVMPVVHPEWFTPHHRAVFRSWLEAHLDHSERFLTNSQRTADDLRAVARERGRDLDVTVVPLGADPPVATPRPVVSPVVAGRFLLVVGTIEPRKNQRVVLDVFDRLRDRHDDLSLVLVGKEGWMVDELVARIRRHPERGRRLDWLGGVDDEQLAWLYDHAFLVVAPSFYEGFGVPVVEALARGCAVIVSTGGAQPEAAGGATELFEPEDVDGLAALVERHLVDPDHHAALTRRAALHQSPTWARTTESVTAALREVVTGGPAGGR